MNQKSDKASNAEITQFEKCAAQAPHHHRGKSSESLLDKETILNTLGISLGQVVLDAGCGNGYMAKVFAGQVGGKGKVYALDPDETAISAIQTQTVGTNIEALVGDITTTTALPASAFDLVYLSTVVHGFSPEQFKGFEMEVKRLLAPDGKLAIVEIVKRDTPFGPPMNRRFSPDELKLTLTLPALATVEVGEYFYMQLFGKTVHP